MFVGDAEAALAMQTEDQNSDDSDDEVWSCFGGKTKRLMKKNLGSKIVLMSISWDGALRFLLSMRVIQ